MCTNPKGYERNRRIEMDATTAFLATDGEMLSIVSGKQLTMCYGTNKSDDCMTFHHELRLNGRRPNGSNGKAAERLANYWNIRMMSIKEHDDFHMVAGF